MRSASRRSASSSAAIALGFRLLGGDALGFEACGFFFRGDALGFEACGFFLRGDPLGFEACGFLLRGDPLGFEACGFLFRGDPLGFRLLGGDAVGFEACGFLFGGDALGFEACSAAMRSASACSAAMRSASRRAASSSAAMRSASACSAAMRSASRRAASSSAAMRSASAPARRRCVLGGDALGFEACGFFLGGDALGFRLLGGDALGFEACGFFLGGDALGFRLLGGDAFGFEACGLFLGGDAVGLGLLGCEPVGFRLLGGDALSLLALGPLPRGDLELLLLEPLRLEPRLLALGPLPLSPLRCSSRLLAGAFLPLPSLLRLSLLPLLLGGGALGGLRGLLLGDPLGLLALGLGARLRLQPLVLRALGSLLGCGVEPGLGPLRLVLADRHRGVAVRALLLQRDDLGEASLRRVLEARWRTEGRRPAASSRTRRRRPGAQHVGERSRDPGDRGRDVHLLVVGARDRLQVVPERLDLDQAGRDQSLDDHPRLVHREAAVVGEVRDAAHSVDLAQQGPVVRPEHHVARSALGRREDRHTVRAADGLGDGRPSLVALACLVEQLGHLGGWGDVLSGALAVPEPMSAHAPVDQVGDLVVDLLEDERLDDRSVDEPEVDEQLAQTPALQLGPLHLEGLGKGLGGQGAGGHQSDAEQGAASRHRHRVDQPVAEPHDRLLGVGAGDGQRSGRPLRGELEQHALDRPPEVAVRHPGLLRRHDQTVVALGARQLLQLGHRRELDRC